MDVAITVTGADDGRFDEGDEVIFYGRSVSGFKYNPATRRYNHTHHRFANINSYLMTFGGAQGRRIVRQPSLNDPNPHRMGWFAGKEFVEEEETNILNSGLLWLSRRITPGFSNAGITYTRKLEGLVPTEPILYRMELWSQAQTGTSNQFTVRENGQTLAIIPMPTVNLNTDRDYIAGSSGQIEKTGPGTIPDGRSVLSFIYTASDPAQNRGGYINWVEWYYARRFEAAGDYLAFSGPDTNATVAYELNGFSMSDVRVYDVTAHDSVREITGCDISGGTVRFQARSEAGNPPQYIALVSRVLKTPALVARIENTDILDLTGAENIIVTAPEFLEEARRLKQHRERAEDPISTTIVTVPNIYNAFNSGVADPTAIRNFIAYAYARWSVTPRYLLLLGDGNYDYLQHDPGTREPQYVPVWESENSVHLINNYVTDDYYAQVAGNDTRVDLAVGRLPVQSADEARGVIDKIIRYDAQPDLDPWRNRLTFVADDGVTTQGDIEYNQHTAQSEQMATSLPPEVEEKKIYIVSYRTEFTAQGRRKPEAAQAIIDQINAGTILVNWTGHGSESVWAHEQVFSNEGTIPQLKNNDRLSFFVAATCTFGLYDRPGVRSGLEELMIRPDRGAIGGLASPRVVFSNDNANYNLSFLANVITNGRESDGRVRRIGDGNFATKQQWTGDAAFEKFYLMGDPAMRLGLPRYRAAIDSILVNGRLVTGDTAQMKALSKVTIAVSVVRPDGSVWQEFNGVSDVTLFDAERRVPVPDWNNWEYTAPGGVLYTGQATVREGRFSVGFIVPKDISYENRNGRLSAYFDNAHVDGVGFSKSFRVGGTDTTADADTKGPDIQLFLDNRSFKAGDMTNENAAFIADLFDESGINTTGLGVGHSIEAWLDGHEPSVVLNEYYRGETDSHQKGTVTYPLRALASGTHTIRLRAWDVYNNSSSAETHFVVANSTQLAIRDVYAYPNPMREQTAFTFQHNQSGPVSVEVKIYTVAGHLVTTLSERNVTDRFVQLNWDGRDAEGDRPANGVYFFKVVCRSADGNFGSEALGKLSILR